MSASAKGALPSHSFNRNRFRTREDVQNACAALLEPLLPCFTPDKSRVKVGATATHYDEGGAQLEGFTRPLWGLAALLSGGGDFASVSYWVTGLANGTDPAHSEYWGDVDDLDQRIVEMAPLGFALAVAPGSFWEPLSTTQKRNVEVWLGSVNSKILSNTNWLWFRVFANLGLRANGAMHDVEQIRKDMDHLDTFYVGNGWSNDGPRSHCQMDYYSGSFAIQTSQLIYSKLARDFDPGRCVIYEDRALQYAKAFVRYFDDEGRCIPFGRSITYRFAMAAFWGALAFAEVKLPGPFSQGAIKGLLLRNLRWWARQRDIFDANGVLNIGYTYPNMFMTENYNSPGSPYWCCLAFLPLALPASSDFWKSAEEPLPHFESTTVALKEPKHILTNSGGHTFLLSTGQACHYPLRATEAKYGKFAYSSAFGFSVPVGSYQLEQFAPDSMLAISDDDGESWKSRRQPLEAKIECYEKNSPVLSGGWQVFPDLRVDTWLLPPTPSHPAWHIRLHRVKVTSTRTFTSAEAGFAIKGTSSVSGRYLKELEKGHREGCRADDIEAFVLSDAGVVGVAALNYQTGFQNAKVVKVDPNSNVVESRTLLPTVMRDLKGNSTIWIVTAIFAIPCSAEGWLDTWETAWLDKPVLPEWAEGLLKT